MPDERMSLSVNLHHRGPCGLCNAVRSQCFIKITTWQDPIILCLKCAQNVRNDLGLIVDSELPPPRADYEAKFMFDDGGFAFPQGTLAEIYEQLERLYEEDLHGTWGALKRLGCCAGRGRCEHVIIAMDTDLRRLEKLVMEPEEWVVDIMGRYSE